ncbi:hypothetical protein B0H10DRAFT_1192677 [Mycena sp. CBHHK59/15]|nr:hypothetical protein B0H10DRAFT_1192677 [Mycena sp. CBHHK59/15]
MSLFLVRFRALALPFLDGHPRPLLPTTLHIHTYGRIPRGALILRDPLPALVRSRGFTPPAPSALGTKGARSSFQGERGLSLWEMSLPQPYEHHLDLAFAPSSPVHLPYPRPAPIVAATLDLPIRALLLRVVASPVCSAPGLRMRSPYRRTCTVFPSASLSAFQSTGFESKTAL